MVSKNNIIVKERQTSEKVNKYGLRKLTVGTASVLLGVTMYGTATANADTATPDSASTSANQTQQANVDTHEVDISSASAAANTSEVNSDAASTVNTNSNLSNSSAVLQAANAAVNSAYVSLKSTQQATLSSNNSNVADSAAVDAPSSTSAVQSAQTQQNTNSVSPSNNASVQVLTVNPADIASSNSVPGTLAQQKIAADPANTQTNALVSSVTLDDGSTLSLDRSSIDYDHQTATLTFASSSFKAGDKYVIKIPGDNAYITSFSNDISNIPSAFGKTTVNVHHGTTITNEFTTSGSISQAITIHYGIGGYSKLYPLQEILDNIAISKNDVDQKTVTLKVIAPDYNVTNSGIITQTTSSVLVPNNSDITLASWGSDLNQSFILNTGTAYGIQKSESVKITVTPPHYMTISNIDIASSAAAAIDATNTHRFTISRDQMTANSDGTLTFTLDHDQLSTLQLNAIGFVIHGKFDVPDDEFTTSDQYSDNMGSLAIDVSTANGLVRSGSVKISGFAVINKSSITPDDSPAMSAVHTTNYVAAYTNNEYKNADGDNIPIAGQSVQITTDHKNGSETYNLAMLGKQLVYSIGAKDAYQFKNADVNAEIPDGVDARAITIDSISVNNLKSLAIMFADGTSQKFTQDQLAASNYEFKSNKPIKSVDAKLNRLTNIDIFRFHLNPRDDQSQDNEQYLTRFASNYSNGKKVTDGDLFTGSVVITADGILPSKINMWYLRSVMPGHPKYGLFMAVTPAQTSSAPGAQSAGHVVYGCIASAYGQPFLQHPIFYIFAPANANATNVYTGEYQPKSINYLTVDGRTVIKVDLSNYNLIKNGLNVFVDYANSADMINSSSQTTHAVVSDNFDQNDITYLTRPNQLANDNMFKPIISDLAKIDPDANLAKMSATGSQTAWTIRSAAGIGLITGAQGNLNNGLSSTGTQDDHATNSDTFSMSASLLNGTDAQLANAVQVVNIPNTHDGISAFNPVLASPVTVINSTSHKDLSDNVQITYSESFTNLNDRDNIEFDHPLTADQVTDWSKIKSIRVKFIKPLATQSSSRILLHLKDSNIYDHVGKSVYLSGAAWAGDNKTHNYQLKPLVVNAGSVNSAKLTVKGQSTVKTMVHYIDDQGNEHLVELPDKSKTYNELADTMKRSDFLSSDSNLTDVDKSLIPDNYILDYDHPSIKNSNETYNNGYENGLAEFNQVAKYDFNNDMVVFEAKPLEQVTRTNTVTRIIHYQYTDGQQARPDTVQKSKELVDHGLKNPFTKKINWATNTDSDVLTSVDSPVIPGYKADKSKVNALNVNFDSADSEVTVIYSADTQKMTVNYIDDTTGQTLSSKSLTGVSNQSSNYSTKDQIAKYETSGYDLVSDDTKGQNLVFDHDDNVDQVYNVHLKHHLENVSRTDEVNETINYVYAKDGSQAAPQYKAATINFTQAGIKDHVTNTIAWSNVNPQEFASVQSPKIDGYSADQASVPAITVHFGDHDIARTVVYSANTQNLDVVFIDDTSGETLKTVKKSGSSDTPADYNTKSDISDYETQHYNLVSDSTDGKSLVFDHNDNTDQHYEVHLSHATHQINEEHDVKQVIRYIYANGSKAVDDHTANVHFIRDGYHDEVTNIDHWNAWTPGSTYDFTAVQSPKIQGFTPDISTINQVTVDPSSQNIEQTVTYYGNVQLAHVKYIDDTDNGRVMSSDDLSGHTGETDSYTTAKNIKNYTNQGYVFVSDNYPVAGVVFDNNDLVDQYFEVHFKHGTVTVTPDQPGNPNQPINHGDPDGPKYPAGTDAESLQTDVSRTIDYIYQNGKQAQPSISDSLHFTETKVIDKVTGKVLSDTWSPTQDFETKITPTINGYTPDRQAVSNTGIDHTHQAIHEVVTYNPNAQKAVVKYIDDTDQKQLSANDLSGYSNQDSGYSTRSSIDNYVKQHYVLVSDDTNGQNVVYDHDDNKDQVYEVHFKHGTETASESRTKNLTVHYIYADGLVRNGKAADDQHAESVTFNRTGVKDLVTNDIAWNAWDHASQTFDEIKSPVISGYTPNQVAINNIAVSADSPALTEKTVIYSADKQKIAINYIDDTAHKTLRTINIVGTSDSNSGYITKQVIARYLKQHYDLVSDDTNGEELVFDHDSNINQVYTVHLIHHTHTINDQVAKSEVIHYVYADGLARKGKAADDYKATDLTFTRDGYHDEVTGEDHWNAWTPDTQSFIAVKSPKIAGYTADQVEIPVISMNSASDNIERTVTYNADKQQLNVVFIDDTAGKTLSTVTKSGLSDESANYNTKDNIAHYQGLHYNLVSDGTNGQDLIFDHDDSKDQHYEVHLVHATHPINEQTSTKQTIHYQLAGGTTVFDDHTARVDFSRDGFNDEVTNEDHWNAWTPSAQQTFSEVISPIKQGYTPNKASVVAINVQLGDNDLEETVIYTPDAQKMTISYIDDATGKTLETKSITGVSDASANYNTKSTIDGYVAEHYKLVSDDTNADNLVFDHDDNTDQSYNVHLTHTYRNVDDHTVVNETVQYIYDNGQTAHPDYKAQAIEFNRTGTQDLVTNDIVWNAWTPAEQSFAPVATPAINGYTPDIEVVPSAAVNHGSKDIERTVTYHTDDQTILVNYVDDDTKSTLKTDTVIGKTAQKSGYTTKKSLDGYLADHYELVSDSTNGENLVFDADSTKAQVYNVHLKHAHQNVSASDSVNETIHYVYADGSKAADTAHAPSINFSRTGDKDLVANEITWNAWTPENQDFAEVQSPLINGYTPSQKVVNAITVKPGDKDVEQTVVYAPDTQAIIVNYIDDVTGKTLKTDSLTGKSDQISDYSTKTSINGYENQRYILVSDDTDGKTLTFDHDDQATQVYNVHLSHQTEPTSRSRTVNETIDYVYADGSKAADTFTAKPLTFTQAGVKDLVTGDIDWNGSWTADQAFVQVESPAITGYTASRIVVDPITISHDASDVKQTVIYAANDQAAKITYIDDMTGNVIEVDNGSGKFGDRIKFGHDIGGQIKTFARQGYKFKSNSFNGQNYQANDSQNAFEVHFTHGTQNVSRIDKVTETVKYHFENGGAAQPDHVQTAEFTQHGVQDLVTKTIVWTPSDPQQFEEVITPKLEGYTPDITNVAAVTIDFGDDDINKVVTYKANTQAADIKYIDDATGKVLKSDSVTGKFAQAISFNEVPANVINDFVNNGYKFVSSNFDGQTYQANDAKNQFEVRLTHNTENVTRASDAIRTIKYQYSNGSQAKPDVHQGAHFEQTGVKDLVTGNIDWTNAPSQSFDGVQTPAITGYTPDIANVDAETVNFGDQDQTVIVTYSANDQLAGIKYVDDITGKTLDNQAVSGEFGTLIEFMTDPSIMIQKFENQGYELVLNNFNGQSYQADNNRNQFEVHFKHGTKDATRTSTVIRTIKYVDGQTGNEIHQPVTQTLTFTENGVTDLVTGETVWTTPSDQHFSKVQSPDIDGYKQPDIPVVDSDTAKFGDGDQVVTVSYRKVETPSTPDTPSVPDTPLTHDVPNTPNVHNASNVSTTVNASTNNIIHAVQTAQQNISSKQSQASNQQTTKKTDEKQLPQTGNRENHQLGLIGLASAAFAGLVSLGKKKRHE